MGLTCRAALGAAMLCAMLAAILATAGPTTAATGERVVVDGFESGGPQGWSIARGGAVQTRHHRTGNRALKTPRGRATAKLVTRLPRARASAVAFHLRVAGPGRQTLVTFRRNRVSLVSDGLRRLAVVVRGKRVKNIRLPFSARRWHRLSIEVRAKSNVVAVFLGRRRVARVSARIVPERSIAIGDLDRRLSGPVYLDNVVVTTKARLTARRAPAPAPQPKPQPKPEPARARPADGPRYRVLIEPDGFPNYGSYHDAFWLKHDRERLDLGFEGSIEFVMNLPTDWPEIHGWGVVTNLHGAPNEPAWDTSNPSPVRIQLHETGTAYPDGRPAKGRRAISVYTNGAGTFNGSTYDEVESTRKAVDLEPYLGRDVRVRLNVKLDARPGKGYYELLLDDKVVIPKTFTATMYPTATHVLLWEGFYRPGNKHPSGAGNTETLDFELTGARVTDADRPEHNPVLVSTWGSPPESAGAPASRFERR